MPKLNSFINIKLYNDSEWVKAKVLSFQPKRIGRNKDWLNVHVAGDKKPQSIDWSRVESWRNALHTEQIALLSNLTSLVKRSLMLKKKKQKILLRIKSMKLSQMKIKYVFPHVG